MPLLLAIVLAASPTVAQMKWERRILIVSAPAADDEQVIVELGIGHGYGLGHGQSS
jgi:hypothetical protein